MVDIERTKELVPECTYVAKSGDHISGLAFGIGFSLGDPWFQALLTTRAENQRYREALEKLTLSDIWGDIARHALEKGE